jgi:hypothetical protein
LDYTYYQGDSAYMRGDPRTYFIYDKCLRRVVFSTDPWNIKTGPSMGEAK